ncbi:MAG: shikimate dehydrogenase [Acidimicrobiales bacterium]
MKLTAATRVLGVVGDPARHSMSPLLHNAAYTALGLDWAYLAFEVQKAHFGSAVAGADALGFVGLSVTMPHKEQAVTLATRRSATARRLGAANMITFEKGAIVADSTDGEGLLADLREALGFEPAGKRCGVIGAGGAARAVILSLAEAGADEVLVVNRTAVRAFRAAAVARGRARVVRAEELDSADLIVQATPAEMVAQGQSQSPGPAAWPAGADPGRLGSGQLAVDLVYRPAVTAWLAEAGRSGATTRNGLGMLVHQAALQVSRWTEQSAPLEAMWAAVGEASHDGCSG